jgi:hypothetical protein
MNIVSRKKLVVAPFGLLALTALLGPLGCGKSDDTPKHRSITGKVSGIDPVTNEVRMLWYNPKEKKEQEIPGTLAPDSEILINGRTARLDEVMVDDPVEVIGRVEKHAGEKKLVALKVYVTRPENATTAAASAPANASAPAK